MSKTHQHEPAETVLFPSGRTMDVCTCGATRENTRATRGTWHACVYCCSALGNDPDNPDADALDGMARASEFRRHGR